MILTLIVFLQQLGFFGQYTDLTGQVVNVDIVNGARVADKEAATALNNQWMHQFAFWYILKAASLSVLNFMPIMLVLPQLSVWARTCGLVRLSPLR